MKCTLLTCSLLVLLGCGTPELSTTRLLRFKKEMTQADGKYISDVYGLINDENYLYLSDYNLNQVFKINKTSLETERVYAAPGKGPGELTGASKIALSNEAVYVQNDLKRSIEKYNRTTAKHIASVKLPTALSRADFGLNFFVNNDKYYLSGISSKTTSITAFNTHSEILKKAGNVFPFDNATQFFIRNGRHLLSLDSGNIIAVSNNLPVIELYDASLNLKTVHDYTNDATLIKTNIDNINLKHNINNSNTYSVLVSDVSVYNNKLYMLFTRIDASGFYRNTIVVFTITDKFIEFDEILSLGSAAHNDEFYTTITVDANSIFAFNGTTSSLQVFSKN